MEQEMLWHDSLEEALEAVVAACGGSKAVGSAMWSTLDATDAGKKVKHCLNPDHSQKFSLDEILWLIRKGGEVGCLTAVSYINREASCAPPVPVRKEDVAAELQRNYISAVKQLTQITEKMNRLQSVG